MNIYFRNICHGSDAVESANAEIKLWFPDNEIVKYERAEHNMVYE